MPDSRDQKSPSNLTDLPPELWDHITTYLPTAASVASLGRTSKSLNAYVQRDGWKTFARARFPSTCPLDSPQYSGVVRSLSTLSRALDRRALVAQFTEVEGEIRSFPGNRSMTRWDKPMGQTIGFAPRLDVVEEVGARWQDRTETLAFSAGASVCVRQTSRNQDTNDRRWTIYRPVPAYEGLDDVTVLHLLQPLEKVRECGQRFLTGTANGDLRLVTLPGSRSDRADVEVSFLRTEKLPVRSGSILRQSNQPCLFAASLGNSNLALYPTDIQQTMIEPLSQIEIHPPVRVDEHPSPSHRSWTTSFLSATSIAVGTGVSHEPIHLYEIAPTGIVKSPLRRYPLVNHSLADQVDSDTPARSKGSSVYTIVPLPNTPVPGQLFLSGAYDGVIRLHDRRSPSPAVQVYDDNVDDSAIYSLLPRGQEKVLAGTSRHNLLKVFDLRLGAKCYSYLDAAELPGWPAGVNAGRNETEDPDGFNVFLHSHGSPLPAVPPTRGGRGRGRGGFARSSRGTSTSESSVYSLASASPHSPYVYAGIENAVMSLAFADIFDPHPDPAHFGSWRRKTPHNRSTRMVVPPGNILGLAMYEHNTDMRLSVQQDISKMREVTTRRGGRLDERWIDAADKI